jgi:hypothetical protein
MSIDREEDWQNFFRGSFLPAQNGIHVGRIEPIVTPEILNRSLIRISANSIDLQSRRWWLAGYLTLEIGLVMEFQRWNIPLNRRKIVFNVGEFDDKYKLRFDAVRWLRNLYLEIDIYTGSPLVEQQQIEAQVSINTKQVEDLTKEIEGLLANIQSTIPQ